jgi:hypothetical protein
MPEADEVLSVVRQWVQKAEKECHPQAAAQEGAPSLRVDIASHGEYA